MMYFAIKFVAFLLPALVSSSSSGSLRLTKHDKVDEETPMQSVEHQQPVSKLSRGQQLGKRVVESPGAEKISRSMTSTTSGVSEVVWQEYLEFFGVDINGVRDGNGPVIISNGDVPTTGDNHAIVLTHGLTDSPHMVKEIAREFVEKKGWKAYLPLLNGHGLIDPQGMKGVEYDSWIKNVEFAVKTALDAGAETVSVGGISTGGALAVYLAKTQPESISGGVFVFSAALKLGTWWKDVLLDFNPIASFFAWKQDKESGLRRSIILGEHPFRYDRMDIGAAKQLNDFIEKLQDELQKPTSADAAGAIRQPLFAAHSDADTAADVNAVADLVELTSAASPDTCKSTLLRFHRMFQMDHSSVSCKTDVRTENGSFVEKCNPYFDQMMEYVLKFADFVTAPIDNRLAFCSQDASE